jgi:hypothetical protein
VSTPTVTERRELAMEYGARGVPGTHAAERGDHGAGRRGRARRRARRTDRAEA